jgi:hypothetical protein
MRGPRKIALLALLLLTGLSLGLGVLLVTRAANVPLGTTILVLRARPGSVELVASVTRDFAPPPCDEGNARFTVEDVATGELVAEGCYEAPTLARAPGEERVVGCMAIRREAVTRLKVPHRVPHERVRIRDAEGAEVGCFLVEAHP